MNRQEELDKLLINLRKADTKKSSDIDLIFKYLEDYLDNPKIGGGSSKLLDCEIRNDVNRLVQIYKISWKREDFERL